MLKLFKKKLPGWPIGYDFRTDEICREHIRPFIESELEKLEEYGQGRKGDSEYIFHEHAKRVAENVRKTCNFMGVSEVASVNMFWAVLPHDIGKRLLPVNIWDKQEKPSEELKHQRRSHTDLGVQIVEEALGHVKHPFKDLMIDIMRNHHEHMDGSGFHGLTAKKLSDPVRLASIVEAYDGWRIWRPHYGERDISPPGVLEKMRAEKGAEIFDMDLFESFAEMKMIEYNQGLTRPDKKKS